ncbi:helicase C-terminal domain-containing protein [Vibrio sp. 1180_3]|uniref:helicase C-terminal domain-containing protein n=1 Tax=Vibrio sp. 1180_3 TaxID=2528832 RepID=UPI0024060126|nr:helicase C-terminal domain-containing protein [Vibrio sp. 1180_3]
MNKKVVISTATIALQEQIAHKDLPLFQRLYPAQLKISSIKGSTRFICKSKLNQVLDLANDKSDLGSTLFTIQPSSDDLSILRLMDQQLANGLWDGDIDSWAECELSHDIWSHVCSDSYTCNPSSSQHALCPFHREWQEMAEADIIVTNHSLVAMDLEFGGGVLLPSVKEAVYVFDEAHRLADIIKDSTTSVICIDDSVSLFDSLLSLTDTQIFTQSLVPLISPEFLRTFRVNVRDVLSIFIAIKAWLDSSQNIHFNRNRFHRFEMGVLPKSIEMLLSELQLATAKLLKSNITLLSTHQAILNNCGALIAFKDRVASIANAVALMLTTYRHGMPLVKWAVFENGKYTLSVADVNIRTKLSKYLWKNNSGIILTSATLRFLGGFDNFINCLGLNECGKSSLFCRVYPSPFDYTKHADLVLPDVPFEPTQEEYTVWLKQNLFSYMNQAVSSLVVFTSRSQMLLMRTILESACTNNNILIQCQGDDSIEMMVKNHAQAISKGLKSVLFGLHSIADGLNLQGELLTNLIIVHLPFYAPDSPLTEANAEFERQMGNNPFFTVTIPRTSAALAQTVGRLIRSESDKGQCVILDKRIRTKRYGVQLLDALPLMQKRY